MTSKEAMAEEIKRLKLHIEDLEKKQQVKLMMLAKQDAVKAALFKTLEKESKAFEDAVNALREQAAAKKMQKQPAAQPPKKTEAKAKAATKPSNVTKFVVVDTPSARRTEPGL